MDYGTIHATNLKRGLAGSAEVSLPLLLLEDLETLDYICNMTSKR